LEAKLADLPLWISTDQAERLKAALEANEFEAVRVATGPRDREVVISAEWQSYGHKMSVLDVGGLDNVLPHFVKWRDQHHG
jgi:hypothetical protein